ncbi:MAG: CPBP family intramembrane metalloprotease, partial [Gemmatimonadetes bacterium]|nr:CPBP family intramembrane metalloprotease [Gemmatimonadota bacterium]
MTFRADQRTLWLLLGGVAGLLAFILLYDRAFPQAAVKLTVTRDQALGTARTVVDSVGRPPLGDYLQATRFRGDATSLLFLQRTRGLAEASRWAREEVPIWTWNVRWFKPSEKEEWRAGVGVDGRVVRLDHLVEQAAAGANLDKDRAQPLAEAFVRQRGWNLGDFELVESSSEKREQRTDHHFTWEKRGTTIEWRTGDPRAGTGAVRLSVDILGDQVGGYRHYLKVPEEFSRNLSQTMSVGQLIAVASVGVTFLLVLAALAIAIARSRKDDVRWKPAVTLAAVVATLLAIAALTSWPEAKFAYRTEITWGAYVGLIVAGLVFVSLAYGVEVVFTTAAGEALGREKFPASLAGFLDAIGGRLMTPAVAQASLNGYALGFLLLGYLTVFYLVAQRFLGAWLPAEGPYSEIFNSYFPFLLPLTIGVVAAVTEEVTYRLFGITLISRYLKSTALGLLIPAMIWAFGHSNYPVFPVYVRGIELTIAGLVFGVAFLRLGLVTCIVAHFVIDAVLIGMPLLASGNTGYVISGVL